MKKIYYLILIIASLLIGVTSCKIDDYPAPDAQVYGSILDSIGGGLIETDLNTGSTIGTYELGRFADVAVLNSWLIKQNGEYRNNLVYSNTYRIVFSSCNFFPYTIAEQAIKPGENKIDFQVVPYIRIKNLSITYDAVAKKINASFNLEPGRPSVKLSKLSLYVFTDMYVGEYVKKPIVNGTGQATRSFAPAAVINPATVYQLSIDLANVDNAKVFAVHRNYFFRVGAMASRSGVGTIRTNYAPYVVIPL